MRKILLQLIAVFGIFATAYATTCPGATAIPAVPTLPYTQTMVCGGSDDINQYNATSCGISYYQDGQEALYSWTPTNSYSGVTIAYSGQYYSGVFLYAGCPTSGGTCIGSVTDYYPNKTLTVPGFVNAGTTYYIMIDVDYYYSSACPGSFTINGTLLADCSTTTAPGNTLSSVASACPSSPFTLSLQNVASESGVTYQWQSSPDNITYSNIVGATGPTYTATQTVATYYQAIVTCSFGGGPMTSTPVLVNVNSFLNCYCTSNALYAYDEEILNVSVGTLNNSSTCSTTGGPGSTLSLYSDYTTIAAAPTLAQSASYNFSVNVGTCGGNYTSWTKIFIDFNQNGLFSDLGEEVYTPTVGVSGPHFVTGLISIPTGIPTGTTRMRVVNTETYYAGGVNACGTYGYGETEDYFVTIAPAPTCPQPTNFAVVQTTNTDATLNWTAGGSEAEWAVEYGATGFTPGTGTTVFVNMPPPYILSGLTANTFYTAFIRGVCTVGDTSYYAGPVNFNTFGVGQYMEQNNDCPTTTYNSITSTGTPNSTLYNGEFSLTMPFSFLFQGTVVNNIRVSNNGVIAINNPSTYISPYPNSIIYAPVNGLYPLWTDLDDYSGFIYNQITGTAPNRKLVIQYDLKHNYGVDTMSFQAIFDETTMEIHYVYKDVVTGSTFYDYGGYATVGLKGPVQNFEHSYYSPTYLQNNTCVKYYYTDCPKPTNLYATYVNADEAGFDWTSGLSNETNWTIEYGVQGFTQGTGTMMATTSSDAIILGLQQNTYYDVYVYSDCANGDQSFAIKVTILTPPLCANPIGISASTAVDSIFSSWNFTASSPSYPSTSFNLQYGSYGFDLYDPSSTTVALDNNTTDTTFNSAFLSGGVYDIYIQSVCSTDTSLFTGPITITMPLKNDSTCLAETLPVNGVVNYFNNTGATVQSGEQAIAPPVTGAQTTTGWSNSALNFTTWFKFVAPATGNMRISGVDQGFDGQIAIYNVTTCQTVTLGSYSLIAANEDAIGGGSLAPNFTVCGLTPGNTYYLMHDSKSTFSTGIYSIRLSEINLNPGTAVPLTKVCRGDTVDLFTTLAGNDPGGMFVDLFNTQQIVNGSDFVTTTLANITYDFQYNLVDGCATDSTISQVQIFQPSNAGQDGMISICKNQPVGLFSGINGNADFGGTFYNPSNAALPSQNIVTPNIQGSYNYTYITSNGVCPADTSLITVNVTSCNFLSVDELTFAGVSLYPNPTNDVINIKAGDLEGTFNIIVRDMNGRDVIISNETLSSNELITIPVTNLEPGMYFVNLFNDSKATVFKVVVE